MHTPKQQTGFSLVEVLVAIAVLLLALVGPMSIAAKGIQSASFIREQTTAMFLAQEGIEAFSAARNDAMINAFASGNLATSWSWVSSIDVDCFTDDNSGGNVGCGLDYRTKDPLVSTVDCTNMANCRLYFDASKTRARYSLDATGTPTPYTRVISLRTIAGGKGIEVKSTVYWNSRLFGTQQQSTTLTSSLFSIYE